MASSSEPIRINEAVDDIHRNAESASCYKPYSCFIDLAVGGPNVSD